MHDLLRVCRAWAEHALRVLDRGPESSDPVFGVPGPMGEFHGPRAYAPAVERLARTLARKVEAGDRIVALARQYPMPAIVGASLVGPFGVKAVERLDSTEFHPLVVALTPWATAWAFQASPFEDRRAAKAPVEALKALRGMVNPAVPVGVIWKVMTSQTPLAPAPDDGYGEPVGSVTLIDAHRVGCGWVPRHLGLPWRAAQVALRRRKSGQISEWRGALVDSLLTGCPFGLKESLDEADSDRITALLFEANRLALALELAGAMRAAGAGLLQGFMEISLAQARELAFMALGGPQSWPSWLPKVVLKTTLGATGQRRNVKMAALRLGALTAAALKDDERARKLGTAYVDGHAFGVREGADWVQAHAADALTAFLLVAATRCPMRGLKPATKYRAAARAAVESGLAVVAKSLEGFLADCGWLGRAAEEAKALPRTVADARSAGGLLHYPVGGGPLATEIVADGLLIEDGHPVRTGARTVNEANAAALKAALFTEDFFHRRQIVAEAAERYLRWYRSGKVDFGVDWARVAADRAQFDEELSRLAEGTGLEVLPAGDRRHLEFGWLTECCQHVGGDAHVVALATYAHPNAGALISKAKRPNGNPLFGFAVWRARLAPIYGPVLVIDSVEGLPRMAPIAEFAARAALAGYAVFIGGRPERQKALYDALADTRAAGLRTTGAKSRRIEALVRISPVVYADDARDGRVILEASPLAAPPVFRTTGWADYATLRSRIDRILAADEQFPEELREDSSSGDEFSLSRLRGQPRTLEAVAVNGVLGLLPEQDLVTGEKFPAGYLLFDGTGDIEGLPEVASIAAHDGSGPAMGLLRRMDPGLLLQMQVRPATFGLVVEAARRRGVLSVLYADGQYFVRGEARKKTDVATDTTVVHVVVLRR